MEILILLIIIILAVVAVVSYIVLCIALKPKLKSREMVTEREKEKGNWKEFDGYSKENVVIKSYDGYELQGNFLKNEGDKFVIITHGHTVNRACSVKYVNIFYNLGFNVLIYDLRHHGENKRCFCSMGQNESRDVVAVAYYLRQRFGSNIEIGLHGESLGAASSLLALGLDDKFAFCVEDCGFSDLQELLKYQIKKKCGLPKFFLYTAEGLAKNIYRVDLSSIKPIEAVRKTTTPILFIHGLSDEYILCSMASDMYKACRSKKEIALFEGAPHAGSYESNPEKYEETVTAFLEQIGSLPETAHHVNS